MLHSLNVRLAGYEANCIGTIQQNSFYGSGRIDALAAVRMAQQLAGPVAVTGESTLAIPADG